MINKNNFKYFSALTFVIWIIIWESFSLEDPVLHYFGIFLGVLIIGYILKSIESILFKI